MEKKILDQHLKNLLEDLTRLNRTPFGPLVRLASPQTIAVNLSCILQEDKIPMEECLKFVSIEPGKNNRTMVSLSLPRTLRRATDIAMALTETTEIDYRSETGESYILLVPAEVMDA